MSATLAVTLNDTATDVVVVADDGDTVGVCATSDAWKERDAVTVVLESPMASAVTPRYSTKVLAVTSGNDSDGVYVKHSRIVCHKHEAKYKDAMNATTHRWISWRSYKHSPVRLSPRFPPGSPPTRSPRLPRCTASCWRHSPSIPTADTPTAPTFDSDHWPMRSPSR